MLKKILVAMAASAALTTAAAAGALDDYNAKYLNSKEAKAATLKAYCGDDSATAVLTCEEWKKTGVPDSDIRHAIIAVGAVAGAVAGGAVVTTPAIVGQSGAFTVLGWTPSLLQGAVAGAVVGAGVSAAAAR